MLPLHVLFLYDRILVVTNPCWVCFLLLCQLFTVVLQFFECALNGLQKSVTCASIVLQMTIYQLKAELEKGPQEAAVYTQQIHQLQSSLNNLQQESQVPHTTTVMTVLSLSADYCRRKHICYGICHKLYSNRLCRIYFSNNQLISLVSCPSSTEHAISVSVNLPLLLGIRPHHNATLSPALCGNIDMLIQNHTQLYN